ncbi:MAG: metal ABC transporter solute-binding protein, Zn/Mn family, partial [Devosiaceae bacterium]
MFRSALLASTLLVSPALAQADIVNVVASFSILGDIVQQVGGEHVSLQTLVGPNDDTHVYEPTPVDVVAVTQADLVVVNGLGFEGFLDRLIAASETGAPLVVASDGVAVLNNEEAHEEHDEHDDHGHDDHAHDEHDHDEHAHDHAHDEHAHDDHGHDEHAHDEHAHDDHAHDGHDDHDHGPIDPHAWHSLDAAKFYVANIAEALCSVDTSACDEFQANAQAYTDALTQLQAEVAELLAPIPIDQRILITSHDAFGYLARDFGLTMLSPQGLSTNSEASAAEVASLIDQVRDTGARALFVENVSDPRLLEQIADETGLTVSGRL